MEQSESPVRSIPSSSSLTGSKRVRDPKELQAKRVSMDSRKDRMSLEVSNPPGETRKPAEHNETKSRVQRAQSTKSLASRFLPRLGSKEKMRLFNPSPELLEEIAAVESVVKDRTSRNLLVKGLMEEKSDLAVKVRFCAAVFEFEATKDKTEKKSKGRKIVSLFIHSGSMFQLSGIPYVQEQHLTSGKLDDLDEIKMFCLDELAKSATVKKIFSKFQLV